MGGYSIGSITWLAAEHADESSAVSVAEIFEMAGIGMCL
jgi:hypothetical protein